MATLLQQRAFEIRTQKALEKKPLHWGEIMREAGYSKKTSLQPRDLYASKGWRELLTQYSEKPLMDRLYEFALSENDKRVALQSIVEILKLKDRYPVGKLKIGAYDERKEVVEEHGES